MSDVTADQWMPYQYGVLSNPDTGCYDIIRRGGLWKSNEPPWVIHARGLKSLDEAHQLIAALQEISSREEP